MNWCFYSYLGSMNSNFPLYSISVTVLSICSVLVLFFDVKDLRYYEL